MFNSKYDDFTFEDLGKGIEICISAEHRFGTDAFLLADFAKARHKDVVCDLCSGSGIVALLMLRNAKPKHIFAVEIQEKAHEQLLTTIERSRLSGITPVLADLNVWQAESELDLVTCNPPYKTNNTGYKNNGEARTIARHETMCSIDDVCKASAKMLKFGGRLCICNRPERLCDVLGAMRKFGIEPKRLRFVSKTPTDSPWLFLVEGKKGSKPFLQVEPPLFIRGNSPNEFSEEVLRIYDKL